MSQPSSPLGSLTAFIRRMDETILGPLAGEEPWGLVGRMERMIAARVQELGADYRVEGNCAVHSSAVVELGAVLKGPLIIGPDCFIAAHAYLRGGVFLERNCIIGPGAELKTSLVLRGSKLAHFNFVGDSILGEEVNLEAGSVIANYRNEKEDKGIVIQHKDIALETGVEKFGALVGDGSRIGANAVIAPGALLPSGTVVPRLGLVDQVP